MVYANNNDVGDGGCETDSDSDYEEDPTSPTVARIDSSVHKGNIQDHKILPGAFTT